MSTHLIFVDFFLLIFVDLMIISVDTIPNIGCSHKSQSSKSYQFENSFSIYTFWFMKVKQIVKYIYLVINQSNKHIIFLP